MEDGWVVRRVKRGVNLVEVGGGWSWVDEGGRGDGLVGFGEGLWVVGGIVRGG